VDAFLTQALDDDSESTPPWLCCVVVLLHACAIVCRCCAVRATMK
jgi:hypothetical protein